MKVVWAVGSLFFSEVRCRAGPPKLGEVLKMLRTKVEEAHSQTLKEKQEEEVMCAESRQYYDNQIPSLKAKIEDLQMKIDHHVAMSADELSEAEKAAAYAKEARECAAKAKTQLAEAKKERDEENAKYEKTVADQENAINMTMKAKKMITERVGNVAPGVAVNLMQTALSSISTSNAMLSGEASSKLRSFLAQEQPEGPPQAQIAARAATNTDNIVTLLEELVAKFQGELRTAQEEEAASLKEFRDLKESLTVQETKCTATAEEQEQHRSDAEAESKKQAEDAESKKKLKADMSKNLADAEAAWKVEERQCMTRQEHMAADLAKLEGAMETLRTYAEGGFFLLQVDSRYNSSPKGDSKSSKRRMQRAKEFLQKASKKLGSKILMQVVQSQDPFAKVQELIATLLERLHEEVDQLKSGHQKCQDDMAKVGNDHAEESKKLEQSVAQKNAMESEKADLENDLKEYLAIVEETQAAVAEATKLRDEQKKMNEEFLAAQKLLIEALNKVIQFLNEAEASGFVQVNQLHHSKKDKSETELTSSQHHALAQKKAVTRQGQPATISADPYQAKADNIGEIATGIQLEEQNAHDQRQMEETSEAKKYSEQMHKQNKTLAETKALISATKDHIATLSAQTVNKNKDIEDQNKIIASLDEEMTALKTKCMHKKPIEETLAQYEEEIASLQEAQKMLMSD